MPSTLAVSEVFSARRSGILLHPTSLPSTTDWGNLGKEAYRFVDFLADAGLSVWQMLPIGPTHSDLSPYQSLSSHAGNPNLICMQWLVEHDWIPASLESSAGQSALHKRIDAAEYFFTITLNKNRELQTEFEAFCADHASWLDDYALFQALREHLDHKSWNQWPAEYRHRDSHALEKARAELQHLISRCLFEQFAFFTQWHMLRQYANDKGIYLFGDIPIFVAHDSADVWANQSQFTLDEEGEPLTVAGVPPDYFSETGQHWGNPHYRWDLMQADGFKWWLARLESQLALFDLVRIDHFRGFESFWEIPGNDQDARKGRWVKAPGRALLDALFAAHHPLPVVAENLGIITDEVETLRLDYKLPGMLVLQFGFDGNMENPHLPQNHQALDVVYTGTHDNDTSLGWYQQLDEDTRKRVDAHLEEHQDIMPWSLIRASLASDAQLSIVPLQDFLELGNEHRMNLPGTAAGNNWRWRFFWSQFPEGLATRIRQLNQQYKRLPNNPV